MRSSDRGCDRHAHCDATVVRGAGEIARLQAIALRIIGLGNR